MSRIARPAIRRPPKTIAQARGIRVMFESMRLLRELRTMSCRADTSGTAARPRRPGKRPGLAGSTRARSACCAGPPGRVETRVKPCRLDSDQVGGLHPLNQIGSEIRTCLGQTGAKYCFRFVVWCVGHKLTLHACRCLCMCVCEGVPCENGTCGYSGMLLRQVMATLAAELIPLFFPTKKIWHHPLDTTG